MSATATASSTWRRRGAAVALAGATIAGAGIFATGAFFTDEASVDSDFAFGTVNLTAGSTALALSPNELAPGDAIYAPVRIDNDGSLALRYAMTTKTTVVAPDALLLDIKAMGTGADADRCSAVSFDSLGASLASGSLTGTVLGDTASGQQAGDRTLSSRAGEGLCFRFALPLNTSDIPQGEIGKAVFTFAGEQTLNNP